MQSQAIPLIADTPTPNLGSVTAEWSTRVAAAEFKLSSIDIYVTSKCNRRCTYCFLSDSFFASRLDINLDVVREILAWASASSVEEVALLGGEPALHADFPSIVALIRAAGLRIRTVTNGSSRFRRALQEADFDAAIDVVAVSLDSPSAATFDALRGPGAYKDVLRTIEQLKRLTMAFEINFTVVRSSLQYVTEMLAFADEQGAQRINMHWFSPIGRGLTHAADHAVSADEWRSVLSEVGSYRPRSKELVIDCELAFGYGLPGEDTGMCAVRDHTNLQFMPDGSVFSCGMLVDRPDLAGYFWRDGGLYLRQADTEVTRTSTSCTGCPMRKTVVVPRGGDPVALCIYNRLAR